MSRSLWSSMGVNPKTSFYFSNGTDEKNKQLSRQLVAVIKINLKIGRDTYIMHDNGGTVRAKADQGYPKPTILLQSNQNRQNKINSVKKQGRYIRTSEGPRTYKPLSDYKVVRYISDGTGRDNYILVNSGGLTNSTYSISQRFRQNLREDIIPSYDNVEKAKLYNPELNRRQRLWSAQKSRPKRVSVPFDQYVQDAIRRRSFGIF